MAAVIDVPPFEKWQIVVKVELVGGATLNALAFVALPHFELYCRWDNSPARPQRRWMFDILCFIADRFKAELEHESRTIWLSPSASIKRNSPLYDHTPQ
ncbi:MAG: hypothetical protein R2762_08520 [Bryobacteraceae bacterium]